MEQISGQVKEIKKLVIANQVGGAKLLLFGCHVIIV